LFNRKVLIKDNPLVRVPRLVFLFIISHLLTGKAVGEPTGSVYGAVSDSTHGVPIAGVNVVILESGRGTSTGEDGKYEISSIPPGIYQIEFSHIGYRRAVVASVTVREDDRTRLDIFLTESYIELETVEVSGQWFQQAQQDTRTSVISVRPRSAQVLPGAVEDVMRTLQAMPGVVTRSDFSSQLIIRGSGPDQNLIVMDNIEVFNPYRLYGLISLFNPETVSNIGLLTGGFPVQYGDRLSAVLDVTSRDGRSDRTIEGTINTNITNANIVLEGKVPLGLDGSWIVSARRTYYDLIAGPVARRLDLVQDDVAFPNFTDLQSRLSIGPYDGHRFYINSLISRDAVNLISGENRPRPDSIAVVDRTDHYVFGVAWHYAPSDDIYSKVTLSRYKNRGDSDFEGRFLDPALEHEDVIGSLDASNPFIYELDISSLYQFDKTALSHEISYSSGTHRITGGSGVDILSTRIIWRANLGQNLKDLLEDFEIPLVDEFAQGRRYLRLFGYLKNRWRVDDRFTIEPGLRLDYYTILEGLYLSPRLSLAFALDDVSTLRGSIGRYLQSPGYEKIFGQTQFFDLTDRESVARLHPEEAIHYVAGIDRRLAPSVYVRLEGYYKGFSNLISVDRVPGTRYISEPIPGRNKQYPEGWTEPQPVEVDSITINPNNDARGEAYGMEVFIEKQPVRVDDPLSGWISYTYSIANRTQYGRTLPFDFDQRHTLNVVMNYRFTRVFEVGAHWRYGSGFPHTPAVGVRPRIAVTEEDGEIVRELRTDSQGRVIFTVDRGDFSNRNTARLPDYSRVDVRFNWYTSFWGLNWLFYLDIINILNRKNIIGYRYFIEDAEIKERAMTMFPIIPTFGFNIRF
jgi:hypothetical protein